MSGSGLWPIARLARRWLLRDRWRSVLVVVLIATPVFAMSAAALILETVAPTSEERATSLMGSADLMVYPVEAVDTTALVAALPPGAIVEAISSSQDDAIVPGTTVGTSLAFLDLDGLASGKLIVTSGRAPTAPSEVAVSADLARKTGTAIGDVLALRALGTLRIVGMVEAPERIHWLVALADPSRGPADGTVWLVGLPSGVSRDDAATAVRDARPPGAMPDESVPLYDVLTRDQGGEASEMLVAFAFVLGALALIEAALIVSAAFAVGIRRRQRELGILAPSVARPARWLLPFSRRVPPRAAWRESWEPCSGSPPLWRPDHSSTS